LFAMSSREEVVDFVAAWETRQTGIASRAATARQVRLEGRGGMHGPGFQNMCMNCKTPLLTQKDATASGAVTLRDDMFLISATCTMFCRERVASEGANP